MVGVDYPHPETTFPGMLRQVKRLVDRDDLSRDDVEQVLHANASRLFGIDTTALAPVVARVGFELDALPDPPTDHLQATSMMDVVKLTGKHETG